jgi:hypothetical protein
MKIPFLTKKDKPQGYSEESMEVVLAKLAAVLPQASATPTPTPRCLLLDISRSMYGECEPGSAKIKALRQLVVRFAATPTYVFADDVRQVKPSAIPDPYGTTDMARAFDRIKGDAYRSAVLITDGLPNDEQQALRSAKGLTLEIFYVGPPPKPAFLDQLAAVTGGQAYAADLGRKGSQQLEVKIRGLLT